MDAYEISSWLESAVTDMAEGNTWEEIETMADDMYNDPTLIGDLIGQQIYDSCKCLNTTDDKYAALEICNTLIKISPKHEALKEATNNFKQNHLKDLPVQIKYEGVDSWNRPIFKSVRTKSRYGSTDILCDFADAEIDVLAKVKVEDLCYFGNSFGCEPMGDPAPNLEIVKGD